MLESFTSNTLEYKKLTQEEMDSRRILGRLVGVMADTKNPTRNTRKYSLKLWENVFNDPIMKEKIKNRCCFGELGHPADRKEVDMEKIAICLSEVPKIDSKGKLQGVFDILDTPNGRILKTLLDYGANIGVSSRGEGDIISGWNGDDEVDPNTYDCEGWDAVIIPAVESARPTYVTESLSNKKSLKQALTESLNSASEEDRKIMEETLENLNMSSLIDDGLMNENPSVEESLVEAANKSFEESYFNLDEELDESNNYSASEILLVKDSLDKNGFAFTDNKDVADEYAKNNNPNFNFEVTPAYKITAELLDESLNEDTIKKSNGKWTNKGDEGTHGEFKTKEEADAQRKAMFANGFKESLDEFEIDRMINNLEKILDNLKYELDSWYDEHGDRSGDWVSNKQISWLENLISYFKILSVERPDLLDYTRTIESLKENYDNDKLVIYKSNGEYEVTPKSNYGTNIQNARKIQRLDGFNSAKEVIDYYKKWFGSKEDDFEVIDESLDENKSYFYILKHGLGPGTLPKDVNVLKTIDLGNYLTGAWLDRFLTTDELKEFDVPPETGIQDKLKELGKEDILKESLNCYENKKTHTTYVTCNNGKRFAIKESLNKNKKVVYNVYNEKLDTVKTALSKKGAKKWITENCEK